MKNREYIILVAICIGFVTTSFSQHKTYLINNGFGITGGITQYDIITDNYSGEVNIVDAVVGSFRIDRVTMVKVLQELKIA